MKCYIASDEFKTRILDNCQKIAGDIKLGERASIPCLACGKPILVLPNIAKRGARKYCNKRCYRTYMRGRFDRWVASPEAIALPQCYDEFLDREELPCLVDGCDWVGKALGNHMNFTHGVTAKEFKQMAGFNLGTGLVSADMAENLSRRAHIHVHRLMPKNQIQKGDKLDDRYQSLEAAEHRLKAMADLDRVALGRKISEANSTPEAKQRHRETMQRTRLSGHVVSRICEECGNPYTADLLGGRRRYCGRTCARAAMLHRNRTVPWMEIPCAACGRPFMATRNIVRIRKSLGGGGYCCDACKASGRASPIT